MRLHRSFTLASVVAFVAACHVEVDGSASDPVTSAPPPSRVGAPAAPPAAAPAAPAPSAASTDLPPSADGPAPASDPPVPAELLDGKYHTDLADPVAAAWCAQHAPPPQKRAAWTSTGPWLLDWVADMIVRDISFDDKAADGTVRHVRSLILDMLGKTQRTVDPKNGPTRTDSDFTLGLVSATSSAATPPPFGPSKNEHTVLCGTSSQTSCSATGGEGSGIPCATPEPTGSVEITSIANGFVDGTITWDGVPAQILTFHAPLERPATSAPNVCCLK
jgi:hypothetical protein